VLSFHPVLDVLYAQPDAGSDSDDAAITGDGPAPPDIGGHFVGLVMNLFMPEVGRRVRVEMVVHLVERDWWKVNDLSFLTFDGRVIDPPVSLAANYRELFGLAPPRPLPVKGDPFAKGGAPPAGSPPAKAWYETNRGAFLAGKGVLGFLKAGGVKTVGLAILPVGGGLYALVRLVGRLRVSLRPEGREQRPL
jgi:hypothetical protein